MLESPAVGACGSRPDLTWRRIHDSPQMTAITIASPTIVRTMLAPDPLVECALPAEEPRFSGVSSPRPAARAVPAAAAACGDASASRHAPVAAAAIAATRWNRFGFVIEGRLRGRVDLVIGCAALRLSGSERGAQSTFSTETP